MHSWNAVKAYLACGSSKLPVQGVAALVGVHANGDDHNYQYDPLATPDLGTKCIDQDAIG